MGDNVTLTSLQHKNLSFFKRMSRGDWQRLGDLRHRGDPPALPFKDPPAAELCIAIALIGSECELPMIALAQALAAAGQRIISVGPSDVLARGNLTQAGVTVPLLPREEHADRLPPCDLVLVAEPALLPGLYPVGRPIAFCSSDPEATKRSLQRPEQLLLADALYFLAVEAPDRVVTTERMWLRLGLPSQAGWRASDAVGALAALSAATPVRPGISRRPTISLCAIVRNEEKLLPRLLASCYGAVDEIVVADTGSTDGTCSIALSHGARLKHFHWCDDFSAARNFAIEQATGDWILVADADEELPADLRAELREAAADGRFEGYVQMIRNITDRTDAAQAPIMRFFRNRPSHRFEGIVHEQVAEAVLKSGKVGNLHNPILHYGYLSSIVAEQGKRERNMRLLERANQIDPENLYLRYQLAHEFLLIGQYDKCLDLLAGMPGKLSDRPLVLGYALTDQVRALHSANRYPDAIDCGLAWEDLWRRFPDIGFVTAVAAIAAEDYGLAETVADKLERAAKRTDSAVVENYQGELSLGKLRGTIASARRQWDAALEHFTAAAREKSNSFPICYALALFVVRHAEPEQAFQILSSLPFQSREFLAAVAYAYLTRGHLAQARELAAGLRLLGIRTSLDADILFTAGDWQAAAAAYEQQPDAGGALRWGISLCFSGNPDCPPRLSGLLTARQIEALQQFAGGRHCAHETSTEMREILSTLLAFGRPAEFHAHFNLLDAGPDKAKAIAAQLLAEVELYDDAASVIAGLDDAGNDPWACGFIAGYLWDRGDRAAALPFLMRRLDQPNCPVSVYVRLAEYMAGAGDRDAAREVLALGQMLYRHSVDLAAAAARLGATESRA